MTTPETPPGKWSRRPPPAPPRRSHHRLLFFLLLLALLIYAGWSQLDRFDRPLPSPLAKTGKPEAATTRLVSLFFANAQGRGLTGEIRQRPACSGEPACLLDTLRALTENPGPGLLPLLPAGAKILGARLEEETAVVDLAGETVSHLPGGTMSELLFLNGVAATLAVNYPQVRQLRILIDGEPVETLKGHVDLRTPFVVDFVLVRPPFVPAAGATPPVNGRSE